MTRTPAVNRESLPEDQKIAYDAFVKQWGEAPTTGPASVMLNAPEVALRGSELARFLRTDTSLSPRIRELAMLFTARARDCVFIWNAHAPAGRAAGLSDALIDSLRDKEALRDLSADEAAVVNYAQELLGGNRMSQAAFDAALAQFGPRRLVELNSLIGCYTMLALNLISFDVQLPDGVTEKPLPI